MDTLSNTPIMYKPRFKHNPKAATLQIPPGHSRLFQGVDSDGTGLFMIAYCERKSEFIGVEFPRTQESANEEVIPMLEIQIFDPAAIDVYIYALNKLKENMIAHKQEANREETQAQANPGEPVLPEQPV